MDLQELNDDRRIISASDKVNQYIDRGFSEQARSLVNICAIIGGIALALPLLGLDNIVYAVVLWTMYARLCALAKKSFGANLTKSFIGGFVVNLIVSGALELLLSFIPVVNFIGAFFIGAISIKVSGAAYLKALEYIHNGNVAERYRFNNSENRQQFPHH